MFQQLAAMLVSATQRTIRGAKPLKWVSVSDIYGDYPMSKTLQDVQKLGQVDKAAHDELYMDDRNVSIDDTDSAAFVSRFEQKISPYYLGGAPRGYAGGLATHSLIRRACEPKVFLPMPMEKTGFITFFKIKRKCDGWATLD